MITHKEAEPHWQHQSLEAEPSCVGSKEKLTAQQTQTGVCLEGSQLISSSEMARFLSNSEGMAGDPAAGNRHENPR